MPVWLVILALFLAGFILIFLEVVIIPGFGVAGILGTISLGYACYNAFTQLSPIIGMIVVSVSIISFIAMFRVLPHTELWRKMRLGLIQEKSQGYQVGSPEMENLLDKNGITLSMLRPSGTAMISGKHYTVITDGEFIEKDKNIIVSKVEGNKIIVRLSGGQNS